LGLGVGFLLAPIALPTLRRLDAHLGRVRVRVGDKVRVRVRARTRGRVKVRVSVRVRVGVRVRANRRQAPVGGVVGRGGDVERARLLGVGGRVGVRVGVGLRGMG